MPFSFTRFSPSSLLVWTLLALALLAAALALLGTSQAILPPLTISVALLAIADAALLLTRPKQLEIEEPSMNFALKRGTPYQIDFRYRATPEGHGQLRSLVIRLPKGFVDRELTWNSPFSEGHLWQEASIEVISMKRDTATSNTLYATWLSRLGFWVSGTQTRIEWTFRVYPNLMQDDRSAATFLMRRDLSGLATRRMFGLGREFDRLRDYQPGDPYSDIYWKASAKRRLPITMVRRVERTQQVYALIDASKLSLRTADCQPIPKQKNASNLWPVPSLERFVNSALSLGLAAQSQGDLFGLIGFSRHPSLFVKSRSGKNHYLAARNALLDLQADETHPNYDELFSHVRTRIRSRSLLVVFTHFDDPALLDRFIKSARMVARQHLVVAVAIRPSNAQPLFSNADIKDYDEAYRSFSGHITWETLNAAEKKLARYGIKLLVAPQASLATQVISRYLNIKERQLV